MQKKGKDGALESKKWQKTFIVSNLVVTLCPITDKNPLTNLGKT